MEPIESRARVAATLMYITVASSILLIYLYWTQISALDGSMAIDDISDMSAMQLLAVGTLGDLLVLIVSVITFLMWFHRAHKNLSLGGLYGMSYTPGWAVGGFFVPFLNFVRPYSVMKEVSMGSTYLAQRVDEGVEPETELGETGGDVLWTTVEPDPAVQLWWACFLIQGVLGNIASRMELRAEEIGTAKIAAWIALISNVAAIPAALYAIKLIRTISTQQEKAREAQYAHAGGL